MSVFGVLGRACSLLWASRPAPRVWWMVWASAKDVPALRNHAG